MSPTDIARPSRRVQPGLWLALLLTFAFSGASHPMDVIDPVDRDRDPDRAYLDEQWCWASSAEYPFQSFPANGVGPSGAVRRRCLLKASLPWKEKIGDNFHWGYQREAISERGDYTWEAVHSMGGKSAGSKWPGVKLAEARRLVAAMPPSQPDVPAKRAYVVGFQGESSWEVRTYDRDRLPPEIKKLADLLGLNIS